MALITDKPEGGYTETEWVNNFTEVEERLTAAQETADNAVVVTHTAASQSAMLALSTAKKGHECRRTDEQKLYRLNGTDPSVLGNWTFIAIYSLAGELINNLSSTDTNKALTAAQGKVLEDGKLAADATAADSDKLDGKTFTEIEALWGVDIAAAIAALINSSPSTLDTLNEIAAALGNDPNLSATLTTLIGTKVAIIDIVDNLTSTDVDKPLSAASGKALKDLIDALTTTVGGKQAAIVSGVATIPNGATEVTVANATVISTSRILLTQKNGSPAIGQLVAKTIIDNTSFVIKCAVAAEVDTEISWMILQA